ncbi:hypothetical protein [Raineyella fluvialis]|nr:hypothetical protein [Raineyella fluvialis]
MSQDSRINEAALLALTGADSFTPQWVLEGTEPFWRGASRTAL